jgi:hypothetical protein
MISLLFFINVMTEPESQCHSLTFLSTFDCPPGVTRVSGNICAVMVRILRPTKMRMQPVKYAAAHTIVLHCHLMRVDVERVGTREQWQITYTRFWSSAPGRKRFIRYSLGGFTSCVYRLDVRNINTCGLSRYFTLPYIGIQS